MTTLWDQLRGPKPAVVHPIRPTEPRAGATADYDRGRRDERKRHRGHPLITLALVGVAAFGAVTAYYAVREGSFSRGGAAVDAKLSAAVPSVEQAAVESGRNLRGELSWRAPSRP